MRPLTYALCAALLFSACAPSLQRVGYTPPPGEPVNCPVKILKNQQGLDETKRVGQIIVYDKGFATDCSEPEIVALLTREACLIKANVINLYNITEPSVFGSTCFQTYADFFKFDSGVQMTATPDASQPFDSDTVTDTAAVQKNPGTQIRIGGSFGPVLSGGQLGVAEFGDADGASRSGFEVGIAHWWENLGAEFDYNMSYTDATKSGYKPSTMFHQSIFRLGAAFSPLAKPSRKGFYRLFLRAGGNYTNLEFDRKTWGSSIPKITGWGYYAGINYEFIYPSGILFGLGFNFEAKNPQFSGSDGFVVINLETAMYKVFTRLSSNEIVLPIYLGYRF